MDFRTKTDNQSFGVRASALMVQDGKIYLAKSPKDEYYLLGGAILFNENTEDAVKRELYEEVGVDSQVGELAFVVENHFRLEKVAYHQIEFLYFVRPLSSPNPGMEEGGQARQCEWGSIDNLVNLNLNPAFLKTALQQWDGQVKHIVHRD